jgi:hypothetical protein
MEVPIVPANSTQMASPLASTCVKEGFVTNFQGPPEGQTENDKIQWKRSALNKIQS